jgi:predicted ATPase
MFFRLSFEGGVDRYALKLSPTADDGLYPSEEIASWRDGSYPAPYELSPRAHRREAGISNPKVEGFAGWVREQLGGWRLYHLNDTTSSSPMRKTARVDDNEYLRPDASNLVAFLFYLREAHAEAYGLIQRAVQLVAPFFEDFQLKPLRLKPDDIKLEWRHTGSDQYFDVSSLSDGTLRFIALATLFLQPEQLRPPVILVDEPELGLHPYAIGMLASLMRQASVKTQVIVSTQSSLLLDYFDPAEVLVADRVEGGTQIRRLDSAQLAVWQEDYSLGQLWEKNEFGGRPSKG